VVPSISGDHSVLSVQKQKCSAVQAALLVAASTHVDPGALGPAAQSTVRLRHAIEGATSPPITNATRSRYNLVATRLASGCDETKLVTMMRLVS